MPTNPIDVILACRERPGEENLGARYVAAALAQAGHRPHVLALDGPGSIAPVARRILDAAPPLVGLAISDPAAALDPLVLGNYLRRAGYRGHLTAGGALATLARHELLARHPALDSIVRHDGEQPMTALADRLSRGEDWEDTPGLTTRRGDGLPAPVAAPSPLALRPLRTEDLPRLMGVPVARVIGSRGCLGNCGYCSSLTLRREALEEGRRSGLSETALAAAHVGGRRRRSAADLADEVAELYRRDGARIFHLLDDNLVGGDAGSSEAWLHELSQELQARRVERTAWSLMIDPVSVTESMVALLQELGVVRVLVGIESLTQAGVAALGRPHEVTTHRRALALLQARGIATTFNSIAVHPAATAETLSGELTALRTIEGAYFELTPLLLYSGSEPLQRLCRTGRVTGGLFGYRYQSADPAVARFGAILQRFALAPSWYDAGLSAHELEASVAVAKRLELAAYSPTVERRARELVAAANARRLEAWQSALALCRVEAPGAEHVARVSELTRVLAQDLSTLKSEVQALRERLEEVATPRPQRRALFGSRSATASLCAFLAAACGEPSAGTDAGAPDATMVADAGSPDAGRPDAEQFHCHHWNWQPSRETLPSGCTPQTQCADLGKLEPALSCIRWCDLDDRNRIQWAIAVDQAGKAVDVFAREGSPGDAGAVRSCVLDTLKNETFPCLAGDEVWQLCSVALV